MSINYERAVHLLKNIDEISELDGLSIIEFIDNIRKPEQAESIRGEKALDDTAKPNTLINSDQFASMSRSLDQFASMSRDLDQLVAVLRNPDQFAAVSRSLDQFASMSRDLDQLAAVLRNPDQFAAVSRSLDQFAAMSRDLDQFASMTRKVNRILGDCKFIPPISSQDGEDTK